MESRPFGTTGLRVSIVGFGAGSIGEEATPEREVAALLDAALDAGVTLVDTARSYGLSEERLGRLLEGRRQRVVLSTKVGYGTPGIPDWTGPCITAGIDAALQRLRTDWLDIAHLHSCGLDVLERGEVVEALGRAVAAGKVRVAAYSGENEELDWAVASGAFGSIQCSVSAVDQAVLDGAVARARAKGLGVLAKRALGNAPWRFAARPEAGDVAEAWERFGALCRELGISSQSAMDGNVGALGASGENVGVLGASGENVGALGASGENVGALGASSWTELFTRFTGYAPGVDALLVGTRSAAHLVAAVRAVEAGPLEAKQVASLREAFVRCGTGWRGRI